MRWSYSGLWAGAGATGTMGYKHSRADLAAQSLPGGTDFLLKVIPHDDGTRASAAGRIPPGGYRFERRLDRASRPHLGVSRSCPTGELPVLEIVSATHIIADLTLGLGKVVHDYLTPSEHYNLERRSSCSCRIGGYRHRAASGIGKEIARIFAHEGATVAIADLDHKAADDAAVRSIRAEGAPWASPWTSPMSTGRRGDGKS